MAIRNGIKHRRARLFERQLHAVFREQRRDGIGNVGGERDFDKNQRLIIEGGMEEGVAAPINGIGAAAQIIPVMNFVHGLIADDFFENGGGR